MHSGLLGDPAYPEVSDYEAEITPEGVIARDYDAVPDEQVRQFEDMITWQDVPIVESQRPELLPLVAAFLYAHSRCRIVVIVRAGEGWM